MEKLAYLIKHRIPGLFRVIAWLAERVTELRFARTTQHAIDQARIDGRVNGNAACCRMLVGSDVERLSNFLGFIPADQLIFFRPHDFDVVSLRRVIRSRAFLTYGLFVNEALSGYALLKISPTGSAFIGLLVHPDCRGLGLGKFLVHYLYWQASLAGLRTRSTISLANPSSMKSHEAVSDFRVVTELPNDYIMIEFLKPCTTKPRLGPASV